ncbi:MAG: hypothetical protein MI723_00715 [Caulobacterales bacterium]|nr:hypothetical protein [Caulobacterales bacterium]
MNGVVGLSSAGRFVAGISCAAILSACATVTRGTNDTWVAETTPPGATVSTSNGYTCTTPCSLKMPRKSQFVAKIAKDGCEPVEATIANKMSGGGGAGMAGNVILGGLIGAAVDAGSGAMLDLAPNPLQVTLTCYGQPPMQAAYGAPSPMVAYAPPSQPAYSTPPSQSAYAAGPPRPAYAPPPQPPAYMEPPPAQPAYEPYQYPPAQSAPPAVPAVNYASVPPPAPAYVEPDIFALAIGPVDALSDDACPASAGPGMNYSFNPGIDYDALKYTCRNQMAQGLYANSADIINRCINPGLRLILERGGMDYDILETQLGFNLSVAELLDAGQFSTMDVDLMASRMEERINNEVRTRWLALCR